MTFDLRQRLNQHRDQENALNWTGTFSDYLEIARNNPDVARLAPARIYDMIMEAGVESDENGKKTYKFFSKDLYGVDDSIERVVEYFHSAAQRSEVRKRILLFMGPVGGGKSTLAILLKRGLEQYTRTEAGATYGIAGCPMHEEPLHLIPDELRQEVERELRLYIEGDLCPHCRFYLERNGNEVDNHPWGRDFVALDFEHVPVERFAFSERHRRGIGSFTPSDPKSQDISELVGSMNMSAIGEVGVESDPRAYSFDGELNVANRGMMEFVEMLKSDERFLYTLLTLSQEQNIKTGRFPFIYADEVIISHTNENEFTAFAGNKKSEALHDRIISIRVPYNLEVSKEEQIYAKLINQSQLRDKHIAPHTLRVAATMAILSRLEPSEQMGGDPENPNKGLMQKLRLYDGQQVDGFTETDVPKLKNEAAKNGKEGMDGLSPRYVIDRLSVAMIKAETPCLNPLAALRSLRDGLNQRTASTQEDVERLKGFYSASLSDYRKTVEKDVKKAFVPAFKPHARNLFDNYLDNIEAFCSNDKLIDEDTGEEVEPDEELMRSIEEQIGISESAKRDFRKEIQVKLFALAKRGEKLDYTSHDKLSEAIENKLFADLGDAIRIVAGSKFKDEEQQKRYNEVVNELIANHGYCESCATEAVSYVGQIASKS